MKYLILPLALLIFIGASSAMAHDNAYVCEAVCSYNLGHGNQSIQLTSQDHDEQTAFEEIFRECKNLNGVLVSALNGEPKSGTFCHIIWH